MLPLIMEDLDKSFDKKFVKTPAGVPVVLKKYTLLDGRESYDLWTPDEILSFIRQREKELLKQLIIIRDTELSDTPMEKSRSAYNINLLIKELSNES